MEQQYNNIYYDEDEIDLKELFIFVLRRWRGIILCALVFAVLAGAYKGISGFMKLQDAEYMENQRKTVEEAQQQYETQKELYEVQLKNLESEIRTLNEYRENSIYMNIDPFNEYHETVTYYISTDYQIMPGMDYQNINLAASILNAYTRRVQDFKLYGKALELLDQDVTVSDVKELVRVEQDNTNYMFTVTIVGPDEKIPQLLMDTVRKTVEDSRKDIETSIGKHSINEVMANSGYTVDTVLSDNKIKFEDNLTKLHDALTKKQKAIDDLKKPSNELLSRKNVIKQLLKFGMFGFVGGGFLSVAAICALFLFGDKMPRENELKGRYGIRVIGRYRKDNNKKVFSFVDSWIDKLEGIRGRKHNEEQTFRFAAANLEGSVAKGAKVMVVGTLDEDQLNKLCLELKKYTEDAFVLECGSIIEDPDAVKKLAKMDGVILAESEISSKESHFVKVLDLVKEKKKDIYGMILI